MLQLSSLYLEEEFNFNPLDLDDKVKFKLLISSYLDKNINKTNKALKKEILTYIYNEISKWLSPFYTDTDRLRYENLKSILVWLDDEIEMAELSPESEIQISMPRVWAYVYYYLISNGSYKMETSKILFYKTISSNKCINWNNFKKEYDKITHPIKGAAYRKKPLHYKDLKVAISEKELTSHPTSLKLAKRDLLAMKIGLINK
jgi:hypothetical protein